MTEDAHKEISMDNHARLVELERLYREISKTCSESARKTDDLHRRLLEPSPAGEPPLAERINKAVRAYEQMSWVGKTGLWGLMTLAAIATAVNQILNWLRGMGKV